MVRRSMTGRGLSTVVAMTAVARALQAFRDRFGLEPELVSVAPGRVNLIGEHTDYNDGFVLPVALPFLTAIAAQLRQDYAVDVSSDGFGSAHFTVGDGPVTEQGWARYIAGMGSVLARGDGSITGWEGTIATDIPHGASLSSSAALEIASGQLFDAASHSRDARDLAVAARAVENDVMGLPSGIMDQLISALGVDDSALLIDCRTLSTQTVPVPGEATIVVLDTGTRRRLVESAYEERQAACAQAATALGVDALRDATLADLQRLEPNSVTYRRAHHVVTENERTVATAAALRAGELEVAGRMMTASHISLRDDYEVSGPALDTMVEVAQASPGCFGARMTGGGFAGCAVALVDTGQVEAFCDSVAERFVAPDSQPAELPLGVYPVRPAAGATMLS